MLIFEGRGHCELDQHGQVRHYSHGCPPTNCRHEAPEEQTEILLENQTHMLISPVIDRALPRNDIVYIFSTLQI